MAPVAIQVRTSVHLHGTLPFGGWLAICSYWPSRMLTVQPALLSRLGFRRLLLRHGVAAISILQSPRLSPRRGAGFYRLPRLYAIVRLPATPALNSASSAPGILRVLSRCSHPEFPPHSENTLGQCAFGVVPVFPDCQRRCIRATRSRMSLRCGLCGRVVPSHALTSGPCSNNPASRLDGLASGICADLSPRSAASHAVLWAIDL